MIMDAPDDPARARLSKQRVPPKRVHQPPQFKRYEVILQFSGKSYVYCNVANPHALRNIKLGSSAQLTDVLAPPFMGS